MTMEMKCYDERIRELKGEIGACELKVIELRGKLKAVEGLKNASRRIQK